MGALKEHSRLGIFMPCTQRAAFQALTGNSLKKTKKSLLKRLLGPAEERCVGELECKVALYEAPIQASSNPPVRTYKNVFT